LFLGQLTEAPIKGIRITYEGAVAGMNTRALTSAALDRRFRELAQEQAEFFAQGDERLEAWRLLGRDRPNRRSRTRSSATRT
jgi:hypothetical protein